MYRLIAHITCNSKFTCKLLQKSVGCLLYYRASCRYFIYVIKLQAMDRWVPGSTRPFNEQNICNVYVYYRNKLEKLFKLRAWVKELKIRITLEIFFKLNKDLLTCSNSSKLVKIRIKKDTIKRHHGHIILKNSNTYLGLEKRTFLLKKELF